MKVAILTWFHYHNYGTALQVCALSKTIAKLGHEVDIINYKPDGKITAIPSESWISSYTKKALKYLKVRVKGTTAYKNESREKLFESFYEENIRFTDECVTFSDFKELNKSYDAFVCGSDQIWAPSCFNPRYFLDFVENSQRKIAYAPSVGLTEIADADIEAEIKKLTSGFTFISTREKSGSDLIAGLIGRNVETVIDPTLLLNEIDWCGSSQKAESDYLIAYFLGSNESYWQRVYAVADKLKLQVKIIPVFAKDTDRNGCIKTPIGPKEFISLIQNAAFVCTDSFHGTVFSINFKKQFLTFERFKKSESNNQNSRIYNILSLTGLTDRLVTDNLDIASTDNQIDYNPVNEKLQNLREHSLKYLSSALECIENNNTTEKKHIGKSNSLCCGCASCSAVCPVNAISMKEVDGFQRAVVDTDKCISCGKCNNVCPLCGNTAGVSIKNAQLYSYKDTDEDTLDKSSSGGAGYRIAKIYMKKGYSVIGCVFDRRSQRAKHILIKPNELEKLKRLQGSKYLQSDFSGVIDEIKNGTDPLVIFGTPCQIAGAKKIASENREIIYVDLICHGVPSALVYDKYLEYLRDKHKINIENMDISFRYKPKGWRDRHIYIKNCEKEYCVHQLKDPFFRVFESCYANSTSCYECRFRNKSEADIRLGDYWGDRFAEDNTGVSMVVAFSECGKEVVDSLDSYGKLQQQNISDYFLVQQTKNALQPVFYNRMTGALKDEKSTIESIVDEFVSPFEKRRKIKKQISAVAGKIRKVIKKV